MKVYILDKILEYKNEKNEIEKMFHEIETLTSKTSKTITHMVVDDIEVYEEFYDYFIDNIVTIKKVKIIAITYEELVNDILESTLNYIERSSKVLEGLSNSFYNNPNKETWQDLNDLLGGISWIMDTFRSIDESPVVKDIVIDYENWNYYAKEIFALREILEDLENALINGDEVTIGDIILYEVLPIFHRMVDQLLNLVNKKDHLNDLN